MLQEMAAAGEAAAAAAAVAASELAALQARWESREARPEDVAAIAELSAQLAASEDALCAERAAAARLRGEMLLREDNYNRRFAHGGAAERVLDVSAAAVANSEVLSWMLKSSGGNGSMAKASTSSGGGGARRRATVDAALCPPGRGALRVQAGSTHQRT